MSEEERHVRSTAQMLGIEVGVVGGRYPITLDARRTPHSLRGGYSPNYFFKEHSYESWASAGRALLRLKAP